MPLSEDEFTCLMIMREGENMIRMRDTRWYRPLTSLHERGLAKPIGNENFVISQAGQHALVEHEQGVDAGIRKLIVQQGELTAGQKVIHAKMHEAIDSIVVAARTGAQITGEPVERELEKIGREVLTRALELVRQ